MGTAIIELYPSVRFNIEFLVQFYSSLIDDVGCRLHRASWFLSCTFKIQFFFVFERVVSFLIPNLDEKQGQVMNGLLLLLALNSQYQANHLLIAFHKVRMKNQYVFGAKFVISLIKLVRLRFKNMFTYNNVYLYLRLSSRLYLCRDKSI